MTTSVLTVAVSARSEGKVQVHCHLRDSVPTTGAATDGHGLWWVQRGATIIPGSEVFGPLDFGWLTDDDGDKLHGRYIDAAGNAGDFVSYTVSVGSAFAGTWYVDSVAGNDANPGTELLPFASLGVALAAIVAAWTPGGIHRLVCEDGSVFPTAGVWWSGTTVLGGGGAALVGELQIVRSDSGGARPYVDDSDGRCIAVQAPNCGLFVDGVDFEGPWAWASGGGSGGIVGRFCVAWTPNGAGAAKSGTNLTLRNVQFRNCHSAILADQYTSTIADRATGAYDWFALDGVEFVDIYDYGLLGPKWGRYCLLRDVTHYRSNGTDGGSALRFASAIAHSYMQDVTIDRTGAGTFVDNNFRLIGGDGSSADDACHSLSIVRARVIGGGEGFELDQPNDANYWLRDIRWIACTSEVTGTWGWHANANGGGAAPGAGRGQDLVRLQWHSCSCRSAGSLLQVEASDNAAGNAAMVRSVELRGCGQYSTGDGSFFTARIVFLQASGEAINIAADGILLIDDYAYCVGPGNGAGEPIAFLSCPSAATKISASSNRNHLRKLGTSLYWSSYGGVNQSLAVFAAANGSDANSSEAGGIAAHNYTNVGAVAGTLDLRPAGAGPQVGTGSPVLGATGKLYVDADGFLRTDDAGPFERGAITEPDTPSLVMATNTNLIEGQGEFVLLEPLMPDPLGVPRGYRVRRKKPSQSPQYVEQFDDCLATLPGHPWNLNQAGAGAGGGNSTTGVDTTENANGVHSLTTGTTATGYASIRTIPNGTQLGADYHSFEARVAVDVLATAGEDYVAAVGFSTLFAPMTAPNYPGVTAAPATDQAAILFYNRANGGDFWAYRTQTGAGATTVTSTVPIVAGRFYDLRVEVVGARVYFSVDGVLLNTSGTTTNVPTAAATRTGLGAGIVKTAGLTARSLLIDWTRYTYQRSDAR